jgi:hypothetical protein
LATVHRRAADYLAATIRGQALVFEDSHGSICMSSQYPPYHQQPQLPGQQPPFYQEPPKASGSGCWMGLLLGCGGIVLVSVLACAGGVWYVQQNADKWVMGLVREGIVGVIQESEIPDGQKSEVIAQVDRVVNAYKARQINLEDMERLFEELEDSPVFLLIDVWGMEKQYLDSSGLSDEEKQAGRRVFERAMRGVYEKKLDPEQIHDLLPYQFEEDVDLAMDADNEEAPEGDDAADARMPDEAETGPSFDPKPITDDDVRKMIADVKKLADDRGIPDEPFAIDIGDEVKKVVDKALPGQGVP